jgi:hypothetical protein
LGLGVFDIVDGRGERALEAGHDAIVHVFGWQAGVLPHHRNDGNVDIRKNVRRRIENGKWSEDQQQQGKNEEGKSTFKRNFDNPHNREFPSSMSGSESISARVKSDFFKFERLIY